MPITFTGYFGAGPIEPTVPPPPAAIMPSPTQVPAGVGVGIGVAMTPTAGAAVGVGVGTAPSPLVVTALARAFTVADVWREWKEGLASQPAIRELEQTWGSR